MFVALDSVGAEHCVLGCAAFLRLSAGKLDASASTAVQITLLAVRKKNRRLGIGRYLMQVCQTASQKISYILAQPLLVMF